MPDALPLPVNAFKRALAEGRTQIGLWTSLGTGTAAEILSGAGFDWLLIDTEHSPTELPMVLDQLRAIEGSGTTPIVRPAWNDPVLFKRLLDLGAQSLLVPYVQSAEEARRAVAATRYPPAGIRGIAVVHRANRYGRVKDYHVQANREMCVLVQIETRRALAELEAIAARSRAQGGQAHRHPGPRRRGRPPLPGDGLHLRGRGQRHRRAAQRGRAAQGAVCSARALGLGSVLNRAQSISYLRTL